MSYKDALRNSEQQLRLITDALPALVSYVDTDQLLRFCNKTYEDWFGHSRDELYGMHLREIIGPNYQRRRQYIERALSGERVSYEAVICDKDKAQHYVYIDYIPDINESGVVQGFVTQIWDMTSVKRAEGSLLNLEQDYRALIDSIEGIVWEADASSFQFTFVSAEAERLLGYPLSQWTDETDFWSNHIHPEDRQRVVQSCLESTASRKNNDLEYRMIASDGREVWLRDIVSVKVEDGVTRLRGVMIDITRQKNTEQQLNYLSNYDSLTDLPNRNLFIDRLERALTYSTWDNRPIAVLAVGIRRLKRINEGLGREAGDRLLVSVAERLRSLLRSRDTVARLSGNEFAVLLADMSRDTDVGRIMEKLMEGLSETFRISGHEFAPVIRIGVSMPNGGVNSASELLNSAETAMHRVDNLQGVAYQHYSQSLGDQLANVLSIEKELQKALADDQLELHYQPQIDLTSGKTISVEALLRWMRPDGTVMFEPSEFIPLAEESGLIIPIGKWVLHRACRDYERWREQGKAPGTIAINVSARQFQDSNLIDEIRATLRKYGIRPGQLELELTENVVQSTDSANQIRSLARMGVQIAIDDFGTGYSSLNYLKHLPVQKLKIDRAFMRGVPQAHDNVAIVKAIIAMGQSMGLTVVAEGLETAAQRRYLRAQGCDLGQGYLYSRPVTTDKLLNLLATQE